jgi:RNAse (barnase) inhibitor barstar
MDINPQGDIEQLVSAFTSSQTPAIIEIDLWLFEDPKVYQAINDIGFFIARIDESPINNKTTLLQSLSQCCSFPDYFGFNWDALVDSLSDFSWHPARGYVLMYKHPETLKRPDLDVFLEIVEQVSETWARYDTPFKLLVPKGSINVGRNTGS